MLVIAGIVPQIWTTFLAKVQFPWRLLVAVDLLMAVLIVLLAGYNSAGRAAILMCFAVTALGFAFMSIMIVVQVQANGGQFRPHEPLEYRAAGHVADAIDLAGPVLEPQFAGAVMTRWEGEEMIVTVSATQAARVLLPINFFPAWVVSDAAGNAVTAEPATPARLLSFEVPPGETSFVARRVMLPEERAGWLISLFAAALLCAAIAIPFMGGFRRNGALPGR